MPLLERTALTREQRVFFITFTLLSLFAPFYYQPNLGGEGLMLPYNASIWIATLITMSAGLLAMLSRSLVIIPRHTGMLMLLPIGLLAVSFITSIERPVGWMVRLGVILGGFLFWFSLFQFKLNRRQLDTALYLVLAGIMTQALVGLNQIIPNSPLTAWFPWISGDVPTGIYQQPNLHASMMATGIAIGLYQATTPAFIRLRWPFKVLVLMSLLLCTANIVTTGSRVGLLGTAIALILILVSRARLLNRRKLITLSLMAAITSGTIAGIITSKTGMLEAFSKVERLTANEGVSPEARIHIYKLSWQIFLDAPLTGHGLGSFQHVFQESRPDYYQQVPNAQLDDKRFSHPHNEILFWMIEGGTLALLSIAAAVIAVIWQLIQMGWQRGAAMAGLLAPISLHTQVELPFYISNIHWIILLFLLFLCFQSGKKERSFRPNPAAEIGAGATLLIAVPLLVALFVHTLIANISIVQFMRSKGSQPQHLEFVLYDFYFRELGELLWMRTRLYKDIRTHSTEHTTQFVDWAQQYLKQIPDKHVYMDLVRAYLNLDEQQSALKALSHVREIYPDDKWMERFETNLLSDKFKADTSSAENQAQPPANQDR